MPEYLELCYQTVQKFCSKDFKINLLDDEKFQKISKTYNPKYLNLKTLAKRSDYISYTLGYEFGGIYMDMDIIVKTNLKELFNKLHDYSFIGVQHKNGKGENSDISVGFFLCRKGSIMCYKLKQCMDNYLNKFKNNEKIEMDWSACASDFLNEKIHKMVKNGYKYLPLDKNKCCYPIVWNESYKYYWSKNSDITIGNSTKYINYLNNATYPEKIKKLTKKQIMEGDYRISHIFRKLLL